MSSKLTEAVAPILMRLHALANDSPELKDAVRLYETVLPLLGSADLAAEPVSVTAEQARAKMEKGLPLLHDLDVELDRQAVADLMLRLARALETLRQRTGLRKRRWASVSHTLGEAALAPALIRANSAHKVRLALGEHRLDVATLLRSILAGENGPATLAAEGLELDPGLVRTLAQYAIKPALHVWCQQLTPLAQGIQWHKGYCFVCGGGATFGELQGNEQTKHLRCGQCGADWPFPRLRCAHCGNEDHRTLGYLYPENCREKMRIEVCQRCKGYLKIIVAFKPTPHEILPVEDLATLHLDYIAWARCYGRGPRRRETEGGKRLLRGTDVECDA